MLGFPSLEYTSTSIQSKPLIQVSEEARKGLNLRTFTMGMLYESIHPLLSQEMP